MDLSLSERTPLWPIPSFVPLPPPSVIPLSPPLPECEASILSQHFSWRIEGLGLGLGIRPVIKYVNVIVSAKSSRALSACQGQAGFCTAIVTDVSFVPHVPHDVVRYDISPQMIQLDAATSRRCMSTGWLPFVMPTVCTNPRTDTQHKN